MQFCLGWADGREKYCQRQSFLRNSTQGMHGIEAHAIQHVSQLCSRLFTPCTSPFYQTLSLRVSECMRNTCRLLFCACTHASIFRGIEISIYNTFYIDNVVGIVRSIWLQCLTLETFLLPTCVGANVAAYLKPKRFRLEHGKRIVLPKVLLELVFGVAKNLKRLYPQRF